MDAEIVLSIVAIVISLVTFGFELFGNQRINRINLEAKFYESIYNDFLLYKIPEAKNKVTHNNNRIQGTDELERLLNDIRRQSIFFKYRDEKFYNEICKHLHTFEDELIQKTDKNLDNDQFSEFMDYINDSLEDIYDIVISKYTGKLRKRNFWRRK